MSAEHDEIITLRDAASGTTARIAVHRGFNCFEFRPQVNSMSLDVIDCGPDFVSTGEKPSRNGTPLLFPFPNRIERGRYRWEGREYALPVNPDMGHAIHGFALDRPWRVVRQQENSVTAEFQISRDAADVAELWPGDGRIEVNYSVTGDSLLSKIRVENAGLTALPFGFGTHTYFKLPFAPGGNAEACVIEAPAALEWELDKCLPTGQRRPVSKEADLRQGARFADLKLDHVLTGLQPEGDRVVTRIIDESIGMEIVQQFSTDFRELVVFTPPWTKAICLEPYTCVTNAINLELSAGQTGWRILAPGESWQGWIAITGRPLLV